MPSLKWFEAIPLVPRIFDVKGYFESGPFFASRILELLNERWQDCSVAPAFGKPRRPIDENGRGTCVLYRHVYHSRKTPLRIAEWLRNVRIMGPRLPLQFEIHPSSGVPIYRQLMDQLCSMIASGRLAAGDLVPSVRQMADELQVNIMTVSKAYARLEQDGVLERDRGIGMRVKAPQSTGTRTERLQQLRPIADQMATLAWQLSLAEDQVIQVVKAALRDHRQ